MDDSAKKRYERFGDKVADFVLGVGIGIALTFVMAYAGGGIQLNFIEAVELLAVVISSVALIVYFFKVKRRYIAIGMLCVLLLPFLAAGGCLSSFTFHGGANMPSL